MTQTQISARQSEGCIDTGLDVTTHTGLAHRRHESIRRVYLDRDGDPYVDSWQDGEAPTMPEQRLYIQVVDDPAWAAGHTRDSRGRMAHPAGRLSCFGQGAGWIAAEDVRRLAAYLAAR